MSGSIQDLLSAAYAAIRGSEQNKALAPITLDHLLKIHIDDIQGTTKVSFSAAATPLGYNKISKLDALKYIQAQIDTAAKAIQDAGSDKEKLNNLGLDDVGQGGAQ